MTFHVDDPTARAPQAILLGVQPDTAAAWTLPTVEGTLLDAIEMARLRTVDPDSLGDVGHFLPALLFAVNLGDASPDTISTDLTLAAAGTGSSVDPHRSGAGPSTGGPDVPSLTIWTRLEPRCRNADLTSALEARTHDPYWMLARQWQFGEMAGDDAGTPILAAVTSSEVLLDRFQGGSGSAVALPAGTPLETFVEREGVRPTGTTLEYRQAVDAGLYFLRLLRAGHVSQQLITAYITHYAIAPPTAAQAATLDAPALALAAVVARRAPDGIRLAADLRAAQPGLPATPAVGTTDRQAVQNAANAFLCLVRCASTTCPPPAATHRRGSTSAWSITSPSTPRTPTCPARSWPINTPASRSTGHRSTTWLRRWAP